MSAHVSPPLTGSSLSPRSTLLAALHHSPDSRRAQILFLDLIFRSLPHHWSRSVYFFRAQEHAACDRLLTTRRDRCPSNGGFWIASRTVHSRRHSSRLSMSPSNILKFLTSWQPVVRSAPCFGHYLELGDACLTFIPPCRICSHPQGHYLRRSTAMTGIEIACSEKLWQPRINISSLRRIIDSGAWPSRLT